LYRSSGRLDINSFDRLLEYRFFLPWIRSIGLNTNIVTGACSITANVYSELPVSPNRSLKIRIPSLITRIISARFFRYDYEFPWLSVFARGCFDTGIQDCTDDLFAYRLAFELTNASPVVDRLHNVHKNPSHSPGAQPLEHRLKIILFPRR
jgi:hypothetical protein